MTKLIKYISSAALMVLFLCVFGINQAVALEVVEVQPAEMISYQEPLNVNSSLSATLSSYFFQGTHIGSLDGTGGVLFANGTIINVSRTAKDNGPIPVTLGDDLRVDGEIWRGTAKGTSDDMPLKVSDTMVPTMDDINDLGDSGRRWQNLFLSGNLQGNNAKFSGNVEIEKLHVAKDSIYDGDIIQSTDKFGAVKAMARIKSDGEISNQQGPKSLIVNHFTTGAHSYYIDFGFDVSDRFIQITPELSFQSTNYDRTVNYKKSLTNNESVEVFIYDITDGQNVDQAFVISVF